MNSLEIKYNLTEPPTPEEYIFEYPTAYNLKRVPKNRQNYDMLILVCQHDGLALEHAAKRLITRELCEIAVKQNGLSIEYIPEKIIHNDKNWNNHIYNEAVKSNGLALKLVPDEYKDDKIINTAIESDVIIKETMFHSIKEQYTIIEYPIAYVPKNQLSKELIIKAVKKYPFCIKNIPNKKITKEISIIAIKGTGLALQYIPNRFINEEIIWLAIENDVMALRYVPPEYLSDDLCDYCFSNDCASLIYCPQKFITEEKCIETIEQKKCLLFEESLENNDNYCLFKDFPEKLRNNHQIIDALCKLYDDSPLPLLKWNEEIIDEINNPYHFFYEGVKNWKGEVVKPLKTSTVKYLKSKPAPQYTEEKISKNLSLILKSGFSKYVTESALEPPEDIPTGYEIVKKQKYEITDRDFSKYEDDNLIIYYISDIHLEHQLLEKTGLKIEKNLIKIIEKKVEDMVKDVPESRNTMLLIAGDVADGPVFSYAFYNALFKKWKGGKIISVLGNHELWDFKKIEDYENPFKISRTIENIVNDYKQIIHQNNFIQTYHRYIDSELLENELYIEYKNGRCMTISEEDINNADENELAELLSKCTTIILGGIGFSGYNPVYNANMGLYRTVVPSLQEDKRRTEKFKNVYDKIYKCAKDRKVIILTHTPYYDWTDEKCNPNWIYIHGHTHQNSLSINENEPVILADNQIGYTPQKWKLKSFRIDRDWYDPFEKFENGIHQVTSAQYIEFNRGRGIKCNGCNYDGCLYVLKKEDKYMFLLKSTSSLCLMNGGQRLKLQNTDIDYYYNHMDQYITTINKMVEPYINVMKAISKEVKQFGGIGTIHGCIVDISYFSHIYVNPYDGQITFYWARDILSRYIYDDITELIKDKEPMLLPKLNKEKRNKKIPLITNNEIVSTDNQNKNITIPLWMQGTDIYKPSRIMRKIQYSWDKNVIRIWKDSVLQNNKTQKRNVKKSDLNTSQDNVPGLPLSD